MSAKGVVKRSPKDHPDRQPVRDGRPAPALVGSSPFTRRSHSGETIQRARQRDGLELYTAAELAAFESSRSRDWISAERWRLCHFETKTEIPVRTYGDTPNYHATKQGGF